MGVNYTCTGSKEIPLAWKCQKCGKLILGTHRITVTGEGNWKSQARKNMERNLDQAAANAVSDLQNCRFDEVKFTNRCKSCGDTPPWSNLPNMPPEALRILRNLALTAAAGGCIYTLAFNEDKHRIAVWSVWALVLFAVLALACVLIRNRMLADAEQKVHALPEENRPRIATTSAELFSLLVKDGMLTKEAAQRVCGTNCSGLQDGENLSKRYEAGAIKRKSTLHTIQIVKTIITVSMLLVFGGIQISTINSCAYSEKMDAADLFTANPEAGERFVIYESHVAKNGRPEEGEFRISYLSSDRSANDPEEVGYIIEIRDTAVVVGNYAGIGKAYRIHTTLRLFDRHTGQYVGDPIKLVGGEPPHIIKASKVNGMGSRPDSYHLTDAVQRLMGRVL